MSVMTIGELIDELSNYPSDTKVVFKPYKLGTSKEEVYSYLIGKNMTDGILSYNISKIKDIIIKRCLTPVQIGDEFLDTAFIVESLLYRFFRTKIRQYDL